MNDPGLKDEPGLQGGAAEGTQVGSMMGRVACQASGAAKTMDSSAWCKSRQRAPQAQDPTNRDPNNLAPPARGRYKPGARRREGLRAATSTLLAPWPS